VNVTTNPVDPITPEDLITELRRLQARIPLFGAMTPAQQSTIVRVAYLDPEFVDAGVNSLVANPETGHMIDKNHDEATTLREDLERWGFAERELGALTAGVAGANLRRRHRLGHLVLMTYGIFRQLIKKPEWVHLIPWVGLMKRTNKFGHKRRSGTEP
jgi:hypothetical protein